MKFVIQRVQHASVTVDGKITGQIEKGFLVLIGVGAEDTKEIAEAGICDCRQGSGSRWYQCPVCT